MVVLEELILFALLLWTHFWTALRLP